MINYAGMKAEESRSNYGQLPAGVYLCNVLDARIEGAAPDQQLAVYVDVAEGEYKDFFQNKFAAAKDSNSKYGDPKYKGIYRLRIPNENNRNAKYPESDIRRMNDMIFRFEKSNPGFHWDGDEKKLKRLKVGINVYDDEYNGNAFTRIGRLEIYDDVKNGLVKPMKPPKKQNGAPTMADVPVDQQTGLPVVEMDDELPF